jgi:hypothetical protein
MMKALFKRWELVYMLCGISALVVIEQFSSVAGFIRSDGAASVPPISYGQLAVRVAWGLASIAAVNILINSVKNGNDDPPLWTKILSILNVIMIILGSVL